MLANLNYGNGQLAATATALLDSTKYASGYLGGDDAERVNITLHNTGGSSETVVITLLVAGGTARRVARFVLATNESAIVSGLPMNATDIPKGVTTNATAVDYVVTKASENTAFWIQTFDANGALKQVNTGVSGNQTISGDISVTNATITGTQTTNGAATFNSTVAITGSATLSADYIGKASAVTVGGTAIGNANAVNEGFNLVTGADDTAAVKLPASVAGKKVTIKSITSGKILIVFPPVNSQINGVTANAAYNHANLALRTYYCHNATTWWCDPETPT